MRRGIGRLRAGGGGAPAWTPAALFTGGVQGAWYDPSDLSSMWQDSAGTTPAAVGQPVGKILDKSGNGNHATMTTAANRPTLTQDGNGKYGLSFNGTNQTLTASGQTYSAARTTVITINADGVSQGAFLAYDNAEKWEPWGPFNVQSPTLQFASTSYNAVHTCGFNRASASSGTVSTDNVAGNTTTTPPNSTGTTLSIGGLAPSSEWASCKIYGLCVVNASLSASDQAKLTKWLGAKGGQTL